MCNMVIFFVYCCDELMQVFFLTVQAHTVRNHNYGLHFGSCSLVSENANPQLLQLIFERIQMFNVAVYDPYINMGGIVQTVGYIC